MNRPVARYHGGKWRLAKWIISHFPTDHRTYTEAYGGAWSVGFNAPRTYSEVYNDLDGEIVSMFRVLRDKSDDLIRIVELTPFSRSEFELSYQVSDCEVEQARRTLFRLAAGHSTAGTSGKATGFRGNVRRSSTIPAHDWKNLPSVLVDATERLRGVVIENMPAPDLLARYDYEDCFHYIDPPYVASTRSKSTATSGYKHEMTERDHIELAAVIKNLSGRVAVSGYRCDLYDDLFEGWQRAEVETNADGASRRIECLWMNYEHLPLFSLSNKP